MSVNFEVNKTLTFSDTISLEDFIGKGYAVNIIQDSFTHHSMPSLFTSFLCEVLEDNHIIREEKKSLNDIQKLLFFI